MIDSVLITCKDLNTEHLRFKYFKESGTYIQHESFILGQKLIQKNGVATIQNMKTQFIPLRDILKCHLY